LFSGVIFLIENLLFGKTANILEKGLDTASLRNQVLSKNLANVDTPGYKRFEVMFEAELSKARQQNRLKVTITHERHIPIGSKNGLTAEPKVVRSDDSSMRNDGNNVDIDREMAALAKNTLVYGAIAQELNGEFQKLKMAINGR